MKKLLIIRASFIFLIFFASDVFAQTFGFINEVKGGNAFLIAKDQSASILKSGDFLEVDSQVLVEEGGQIAFSDYFDHKYQLSSGSLVKFNSGGLELNRGSLRVSTLTPNGKLLEVQTPNAIIGFSDSEGAVTFEPETSKTEVLSFDGVFDLRAKKESKSSVVVSEGNASFVKDDLQMGMPSIPRRSSSKELEKIASIFLEEPRKTRMIASTKEKKIILIKAHKPKYLKSHRRVPASVEKSHKAIPIRIIGAEGSRHPSSETKSPKEVDSLIKDLKSYKSEPKSL